MPAAGQPVSGVEDVLRARANARRIKEHYEGTLGVPSELQSLSHLLSHDMDAVFAGLENLPLYSKSSIPAPPAPPAPEPPPQPAQPATRRRTHARPSEAARRPSYDAAALSPLGTPPSPLEFHPWDPSPTSHSTAETPQSQQQQRQPHQLSVAFLVSSPFEQAPLPSEPGAGPNSPGRMRLPSGLSVDPWRWAPGDDFGQAAAAAAAAAPGRSSETFQPHLEPDPRVAQHLEQRPSSRAGTASPGSSRQASPTARGGRSGALSCLGPTQSTTGAGGAGFGSRSGSRPGSPVGFVSVSGCAVLEGETEEERKIRMARQRLLSPNDLSPQEWARIGLPQDAADLEKFIARNYSMSVDFDRQTLLPKRVAKPDIFHISPEEAQRRQVEADEATLALQAQRRAEMEAEEQAAEAERLARSAARGPRYDAMGVRRVERSTSPVLPRYLDWHPCSVGGLGLTATRRSHSGGSGGAAGAASASASRCASASRSRPDTATSAAGMYGTSGGDTGREQQPGQTRQMDPALAHDPYVYEDLGEDVAGDNEPDGVGAAYGTRPPRRRHHSALAFSFAPTPRPAGVTDAHYAQMVRQQRKWLNAPAQPQRPVSAAPFPAPMSQQYVRPRSSRPPPDGTAAPIPSRVAAEAAAQVAAAEAATRPNSALQTVITQRTHLLPPRPQQGGRGGRGRSAPWAPASTSSRPVSATTSATSFAAILPAPGGNPWALGRHTVQPDGGGAAAAMRRTTSRPASAAAAAPSELASAGASGSVQMSYATPTRNGKRLPWEAREHVAAAAAVGIVPPRLTWDELDLPPAAAAGGSTAAASQRRSSTGHISAGGRSRGSGAGSARQRQQQQQQQARQGAVFGETVPPEGAGRDSGEQYLPRKFEMRNEMVLEGYIGR
ncbi:hypothetical protein PLESTB_000824200 [Pleodorina starrii]|uniref:Uncharacterized protein n=1 Tax=Pleodorina starrii TaxID=330485 RepID=A0A9W6F356_9CHLO|nr:hypothetical protein PLESTB_000824200 [Pleodorina starrii]